MPARNTPQGLAVHPMLRKIIEAHLSGQSPRQIASWVTPPVAHTTIYRYIAQHVTPVMGNAEALKSLLNTNRDENKEFTSPLHGVAAENQVDEMAIKAIVGAPVLSIRDNRIAAKQDRWRRLAMIVNERAEEMGEVPGGASGLLCRDFKGSGDGMQEVYKFDAALVQAFEECEKNIAIELGQWQEGVQGAVSIQILCPSSPDPAAMPRVTYAAADQIEASTEEIGLKQLG